MAFLAAASSLRAPISLTSFSSKRRSNLATAIQATPNSASPAPHPLLSSLRLAASAAVFLAAASPARACTLPPPPAPAPTTTTSSSEDLTSDDQYTFEKLIVETAELARCGGAAAARARLSASSESALDARLLAAQALFVEGKVHEAIAALEELAREDPGDYRPVFCQCVMYVTLGRVEEADLMFQRCREIAGDKFGLHMSNPASLAEAEVEKVEAEAEAEKV